MDNITTTTLSLILLACIILSGFFSSAETGMMSLNRYRLKHLAKNKHKAAQLTQKLLNRPDRLIGLILIGNNFVNFLAASIATVLCVRIWGDLGLIIAPFGLTAIVLIFSEVTPKTLAAIHPEKIAFPASFVLMPLYKIFFPLVVGLNAVSNGLLRIIGVKVEDGADDSLSSDELKTVVHEAGPMIPKRHQKMLLSILDLEQVTVEDIMVPRNEITGINLDAPMESLVGQMTNAQHTRLPLYHEDIDKIEGFLHAKQLIRLLNLSPEELDQEKIKEAMTPVYFIPEGTPLNTQLLNFQRKKLRIGLVVDEYGDILGLVTLEDILEEIVGEFTTDFADSSKDIQKESDGSIIIDGTATVRDINKALSWSLPTDGPKTLNGLILEYIESIPKAGTGLRLSGYPMEIMQIKANMIKSVRVWPELYVEPKSEQ